MMVVRILPLAALTATLTLATAATAVQAAPSAGSRPGPRISAIEQVQAASAEVDEGEALNCGKSRKRLWVEGEGWVVRKITTCH